MCGDSHSKFNPFDMEMGDKRVVLPKTCSRLLEFAAVDDLTGFIQEIEKMGGNVDEVSFWYGRSFGSKKMSFEERIPVMIASLYGSIEILKYLIATCKVDVNRVCGSDGATALHCAAAGGSWSSVEVVKLLVEAGADITAIDADGKKPGDLIAPCVKFTSNLQRKTLEMLLNGEFKEEKEEIKTIQKEGIAEKKEYPIDVSLPDINDGLYGTDEFRMYSFKVKPCSRAYSHDWTECPFVHPGENARRRDPRKYHYTCVPCPEFKKGTCVKNDACEYAHGVFESWLHPAQYRTRLCKDENGCPRKVCFFAHKTEELRPLYASTGSAMPSPKSGSITSLDLTNLAPLNLGSTPPMSPSITCSSPMWQNKVNFTPPSLQLPGSRLKTAFNARDVDLEIELLGLEKIRTQQQRQQIVEELASLSSPYGRMSDLNPTNLDDVFGSLCLSPTFNNGSPTGLQMRQNMNQLRASYPSNNNISSSPTRKLYGFDSSAAVAAAVMNSRSAGFSKRSQSFNYRSAGLSGAANSPSPMPSKLSEWGSANGKVDWGFNGEEVNKLRKSASFGFRSGGPTVSDRSIVHEPDVSWVNSMVRDVPSKGAGLYSSEQNHMPHWVDQLYMDQDRMVA